jgi:hypothetical protein
VTIVLGLATAKPFAASYLKNVPSPLSSPLGVSELLNPGWFQRLNPTVALAKTQALFAPTYANAEAPTANTLIECTNPVSGGVSNDGGVLTDETAQAKSGLTKDQSYETGDDGNQGFGATSTWEAQTFTTSLAQRVKGVWLKLFKQTTSDTPGTVTVSIRATDGSGHPTGADLCQGTIDGSAIQYLSPGDWVWIPFTTGVLLGSATKYAIVVRVGGASGLNWRCDTTSPTYAGGNREYSTNAGTSWTTDTTRDFMFKVYYTLDDMDLLPTAPLAVGDAWYWGYGQKFDRIYQDIGVAGAGTYTLAFEYSQGGGDWTACVNLVDGTSGFRNPWLNVISYTKQGDWATDTISGRTLYWIRARVTDAGTGYSQPKGTYARVGIDI